LLFAFLLVAQSFTVWEWGFSSPLYQQRSQWGLGNPDVPLYFRNWTMTLIPDPCPTTSLVGVGKDQVAIFSIDRPHCNFEDQWANIGTSSYVAAVFPQIFGSAGPLFQLSGSPKDYVTDTTGIIPFLSSTNVDINVPYSFIPYDFTSGLFLAFIINFPKNPNMTAFLTPPAQSLMWLNFLTLNTTQSWVYATCVIISIVVMIVAAVKWFQFFHYAGFKAAFPIIVLTLSFIGGLISLPLALVGFLSWHGNLYTVYWGFWIYWPLGASTALTCLMALYLRELAVLTNAYGSRGVGGLDVFFWPAVVVVSVLWAIIIISGGLQTNPNTNVTLEGLTGAAIAQIVLFVLTFATSLFLVLWGGIPLLFSTRTMTGASKWTVIRVVVFSICTAIVNVAFGMAFVYQWSYFVTSWDAAHLLSVVQIIAVMDMFQVFVPCCVIILVMLNFQVRTEKEIELSKSATASTSGTSNKSFGSSSGTSGTSSSHQDVAIEL